MGNDILHGFDYIQLGIILVCIPTPPRLWSKCKIATCKKKKYIGQVHNKKHENYDPTSNLKTCGHILFDILGSNFVPYWRYFRYLYSNI